MVLGLGFMVYGSGPHRTWPVVAVSLVVAVSSHESATFRGVLREGGPISYEARHRTGLGFRV